ncbi:phosphate ABC transporter substrate-binding protein PstS [Arthrobacter echini]|uniref:Phosphate-binding protein n=1 Tax=Arthrobacter echini TaxID=1529066 RepID=A0A5D0XV21_9MICC|nr:phosphate ABC transporter substrate-binding protein PstS [Arthrobacter echini]TYD00653.1 phosphate ABC transporter substrate-binding protein PstS [Arthrobacter echini]
MKALRSGRTMAVISLAALALTACGSDDVTGGAPADAASGSSTLSGTLTGAGSSAQNAAMTAWQSGFAASSGADVQYSPDGSGAGRDAFLAEGVQFAGSDAALDDEEYDASKEICGPDGAIDIPVYVSPIAIAFNLPGIDTLDLDAATIASVFRGEVESWDDEAIAAQNEGVELPTTPITVVHRADDSGTTENFTEYLAAAAPEAWTDEADGAWPEALVAENAQGTNGVVSTTTGTDGAITYADASAVGDLGRVSVLVGEEYVPLSADAAGRAVEAATRVAGRSDVDMSLELERDTTESGAYPVVLVSYHVVCSSYADQETVDLVKAFETYVVSAEGQDAAAASAGSAPLPEDIRADAMTAIGSITVGSS